MTNYSSQVQYAHIQPKLLSEILAAEHELKTIATLPKSQTIIDLCDRAFSDPGFFAEYGHFVERMLAHYANLCNQLRTGDFDVLVQQVYCLAHMGHHQQAIAFGCQLVNLFKDASLFIQLYARMMILISTFSCGGYFDLRRELIGQIIGLIRTKQAIDSDEQRAQISALLLKIQYEVDDWEPRILFNQLLGEANEL